MSARGATVPPTHATLEGAIVDFAPILDVVAHRYFTSGQPHGNVPEDLARRWHAHDTAYLLQWAIDDVAGYGSLERELRWLADLLHHRGFPLDGLAVNLDMTADAIIAGTDLPSELVTCFRKGGLLVREIDAERRAGLRYDDV